MLERRHFYSSFVDGPQVAKNLLSSRKSVLRPPKPKDKSQTRKTAAKKIEIGDTGRVKLGMTRKTKVHFLQRSKRCLLDAETL